MKILAIETSCDDTCISIIEANASATSPFKVLSNIVSSQTKIHKPYGGVFPMMAKREHQKNLVSILIRSLTQAHALDPSPKTIDVRKNQKFKTLENILKKESNLFESVIKLLERYKKPNIDLVAVTQGPGLEPCLWVGLNFAKALSSFWNIPVIPVNHIEAHILVNLLENKKIEFPAIALVVSGGHTQLILVKKIGSYKIIGETRDDAAGECFDKAAKILNLGYPGGPTISRIASKANGSSTTLPRPMIATKDYDFSFSGLKTAVLYKVKSMQFERMSEKFIQEMCFEIQQAIIEVLIKKTVRAAKDYQAKTIILGGGVSANSELRKQLGEKIKKDIPNTRYLIPNTTLSTDNALMIAITGFFHRNKRVSWQKLKADANLRIDK